MTRHPNLVGRFVWLGIAAAAATTFSVAQAAARPAAIEPPAVIRSEPRDPCSTCLRAGPRTADRIEARAAECRMAAGAVAADPAFVDCLRHAASTPDAIERWLDACRVLSGH